jgi:hypothetical protein
MGRTIPAAVPSGVLAHRWTVSAGGWRDESCPEFHLDAHRFAAVVIVVAVVLAIRDAGSFHRGGEFASAWQSAELDLLAWSIVLVFSGGAFALVTVLLIPSGRVLPLPLIVGLVCGAAVVASFELGFANHLQRSAGIPWPLIAVAPGVAAGGATVALALVTNLFSGDAHAST